MTPNDSSTDGSLPHGRRSFLQALGVAGGLATLGSGFAASTTTDSQTMTYELPPLPYDYDALEPHVEQRIMELHHDEHHQGYVDGANAALADVSEMRDDGDFDDVEHVKRDLAFNLSGHALHSIFWENMTPDGGGDPAGELADAIESDFGSIDAFRDEFSATAENVEDSGWGLLVYDHVADRLLVTLAENHQHVAVRGATPLLVLDVWEHAYYPQYENRRAEYVEAWWNVVDWEDVAARYDAAANAGLVVP